MTSTGSAGDCYDNAMAESFFATLECELIKWRSLKTQAEARTAIFEFIEGWYNTKRRHSALGYLSPNEFERRTAATARHAQGDARGRERTGLEPCQIGRPGTHNHPLEGPQLRSPRESYFHRLSPTSVPVATALNRPPNRVNPDFSYWVGASGFCL